MRALLPPRASQTWAMLIKRVYGVDPLTCEHCDGQMKVLAFIEPPQVDVIERILRHCELWQPSTLRPPRNAVDSATASDEPVELTYVDEDTCGGDVLISVTKRPAPRGRARISEFA